jgi:hypothetical protein
MDSITAADCQKAKLALLFSTLGVAGFLLTLVAGVGLWGHAASKAVVVPTYDRFVDELRATAPERLPGLTSTVFEKWSACEATRKGMTEVAIHALVTSSIVAIALFTLCLALNIQVYRRLDAMVDSREPPQPPDSVDETWKS